MDTIPHRMLQQGRTRPDAPGYYEKQGGQWVPTSWASYAGQTQQAARALLALGLPPEGKVCILSFNRAEWVIADVACMAAGGVPAGIYETCSAEEVGYIVQHSGAHVVFVEDDEQLAKVLQIRATLPELAWIVTFRGVSPSADGMVLSWDEFLARGSAPETEQQLSDRLAALTPGQPATFIYTSGTTGPPKAVMLSHHNLTWTADTAIQMVGLSPEDSIVSYLPLSHIAEQMFTIHAPMTAGCPVYFAESRDKVAENLVEVQPTVVFGVPRVWEKIHARITGGLATASPLRAGMARWAMGVGRAVSHLRNQGQTPGLLLSLQHQLASRLVFQKARPRFGMGRARIAVSGAAPISPEVIAFFSGLDLIIHEVYGQSEDCGPTTFNTPGNTRFGTVGTAIPGLDLRIAEDGEIQVRGPNVFLGYYKDEAATAESFTADGWLCTGDLGAIDADGFLTITGRKKEIIITAGGKNIAPKNIEAALKDHALVSQAVVIGDRRKFLSALITLDPEATAAFAQEKGITGAPHEHPAVLDAIQAAVNATNERFARVEHIRKFSILPRDLDLEHQELTPTLKVKRRVVYENWAKTIEAMYAE